MHLPAVYISLSLTILKLKLFCCLDRKKSPLQILATSTYALEQKRKCPGSLDMLAEHSSFEDVENLFNLLGFFDAAAHFPKGTKED